jgi:hypothetical protein
MRTTLQASILLISSLRATSAATCQAASIRGSLQWIFAAGLAANVAFTVPTRGKLA